MTSEFIFWCIAGLMLAAAAFFIAAAFLRTRLFSGQEETSEKANRKLLNEELEVLEKEKAAGLISQSIYEESVDDVRRRALRRSGAVRKHEYLAGPRDHVYIHNPVDEFFRRGHVYVAGAGYLVHFGNRFRSVSHGPDSHRPAYLIYLGYAAQTCGVKYDRRQGTVPACRSADDNPAAPGNGSRDPERRHYLRGGQ